jgi:hypothetical protein
LRVFAALLLMPAIETRNPADSERLPGSWLRTYIFFKKAGHKAGG